MVEMSPVMPSLSRVVNSYEHKAIGSRTDTTTGPAPVASKSLILRGLYYTLGAVCFAVGVAGYIMPVLPGTFPMICAAFFFGKADPRVETWMLNHPVIGPSLRVWRATGSISVRVKAIAVSCIVISSGATLQWVALPMVAVVMLTLLAVVGVAYILTRPNLPAGYSLPQL
jgi:uncharacterized membrane protein YbaN (DUF454 family)